MKTVAILGASSNRAKFGNKAVRAFHSQGYEVFPINPTESLIEGLPVFRSIMDLPVRPDLVSVYVPPDRFRSVLPEVASKGCDELWLNPGADDPDIVREAQRLGLNVVQACSILGVGVSPHEM